MKKYALFAAIAFNSCASYASTEGDIASAFKNYWSNFSCGKYYHSAKVILPSDLKETKDYVLPLMITEKSSRNSENKKIANTFFSVATNKKPADFDEVDVYAGMNKLIGADAETMDILCFSKVNSAKVSLKGKNKAVLSYSIILASGDVIEGDPESFTKIGEKWYLNMSMPPKEIAKSLNELFQR